MKEKVFFTFTNIGYAASQWLIIIVAARISLDLAGEYSYSLAVVMPIIMFFSLGLRGLLVTEEVDSLFMVYYAIRGAGVLIIVLLSLLGYYIIISNNISDKLFISVLIYKTSDMVFDICYARYQQIKKIYRVTYSKLVRLTSVLILFGVVRFFYNIEFYYLMMLLCALSVVQSFFEIIISVEIEKINIVDFKSKLFNIVNNGLKLSIVLMLVMLISSMPRFYIEKYYGLTVLGEFAFINQIIQVGMIIVQSISFIYLKKISDIYKCDRTRAFKFFDKIILTVFVLSIFFGGVVAVYFSELSLFIINLNIDLSLYEVTSILIFSTLLYSQALIGGFLTAIRKISVQPILFSLGFCLTAIPLMLFELSIGSVFLVSSMSYFIVFIYYCFIRIKII